MHRGGSMDLEQQSAVTVDTAASSDIAESCNKLLETQKKLKAIDEERKKYEDVERTLSEETIPNLMHNAGISMLKLADGSSVEINKKYYARIPASRQDEAFNWLREHGHEDLIKNDVSMSFGMKQDNEARSIAEDLKQRGFDVKQKTSVHHSTLFGFVREQIEDGKNVPHDLFGVYVRDKTKIITKDE